MFIVAPILGGGGGVQCLIIVLLFRTLFHSSLAIILMGKRELVALLISFLMSCDCKCALVVPHGAMGWSAVCDCGIY